MKLPVLIMMLFTTFILIACQPGATQAPTYRSDHVEDVTYHAFRTNARYVWDGDRGIMVIEELEELENYLSANDTQFDFTRTDPTFKSYVENKETAFFDDHYLILIKLQEVSGSIWHELDTLEVENDTLMVTLNAHVPEIGTTDMAAWHLIIEVPKASYTFDDVALSVTRIQE